MKRDSHPDAELMRRTETAEPHLIEAVEPRGVPTKNLRPSAIQSQSPAPDRSSAIKNTGLVEVSIGELVLNGFSPADRLPIADAIGRELERLFSEEGIPPSLSKTAEADRLSGGAFRVAAGERQTSIGEKVARAIYGGLS